MACVTACPSGVRYDLLIEQTREVVEEQYERPAGDWLLRTLVFSVFPHPRRLRAALALSAPAPACCRAACAPLAELAPPWRYARADPLTIDASAPTARPGRPADGLRAERRLRRRERGHGAGAGRRGLRGRDATRPGLLRRAPSPCRAAGGGEADGAGGGRDVRRCRRNRRQRRGLRLAPEGRGARRARRRRLRAAGGGAEGRASSARRCASPSRTRAIWPTRRGSAWSRAISSTRSPASSAWSRRSRRSVAGRPGSTTSRSPRRRASSVTARPSTSSRRSRTPMRAPIPAASCRSRPRCAERAARCRRCTRSSSSTRRSAASQPDELLATARR